MTAPLRAALYLRVSTARQAEHDVSIPDQRRQGEAYCQARGYQLVETYVEAGASATNDRRPEFQRMIEAGTSKPAPFDVVIVHSFNRFFRDHFELEFYVRKLARNGVRLVSITQEMGDDPMHVMMRQIMALFDEYPSKENAKHVLRAQKENARQGFWNGARPPIGYRVVEAEQRGAKVKKKLEIDPLHADTVRLIYRLAVEGDGTTGQMGVKNIVSCLNTRRIFTRDGGCWGIGQVHRILTRRTYMGEHEFNKRSKTKELKPVSEIVVVPVPPIISRETFDAVQVLLKARHPKVTPSAVISGPTMLTGLIRCAKCGGAMTIRTGKGGRYRYYACSMKARQVPTACTGMAVPMEKLDDLVASHLDERLLQPERLETILATVLDRRQERSERQREHIAELNRRAAESEARLRRLYDAMEAGVADLDDPVLKDRIAGLKVIRDQAKADAERAQALLQNAGSKAVTPEMLSKFAKAARQRIRLEGGGYRRDHLRALAQRVEVAEVEVRIMGSKSRLLQTLVSGDGVNAVPSFGPKWRKRCP
ncbi:recombinase family protein [Ancylobacter tetraedralis]|nr:recombinase family protein [Ancylobacter tetraedralis]